MSVMSHTSGAEVKGNWLRLQRELVATGRAPSRFRRSSSIVTLEQIRQAQERIAGVARKTPLLPLGNGTPRLWLKLESFQPIGSFKLRGAYNKIALLSEGERRRGGITYSSGNHAQGVAYAARALGAPATVVMPRNAPPVKIASTQSLGAEIV